MNTLVKVLVAVACLPSPLAAYDVLVVSAQIDGHSHLIVKRDQVYWQHYQFARPGRHLTNLPTVLNGYQWYPVWPDGGATGAGVSAPLRLIAAFSTSAVTLTQEAGRQPVTIVQQPDATNDFTLVIDFDDAAVDGPDYYTITLSALSVTLPPLATARVACIAVSWPTETNRVYQLQYCSTVTSNAWLDLGAPVEGQGTNAMFFDQVLGEPQRFYRVMLIP